MIGDYVFTTHVFVSIRCGFSVLGEIFNPLGILLADSVHEYREYELGRLFKSRWSSM